MLIEVSELFTLNIQTNLLELCRPSLVMSALFAIVREFLIYKQLVKCTQILKK